MDEHSFFHLVTLIENNPIAYNKLSFVQAPIESQLAVILDRLGHNGNGACLNHMSPMWDISSGSLVKFTECCFVALCHHC